MRRLTYTLLADGASDSSLIPILTWLLRRHCGPLAIQAEFADLRRLPIPPKKLFERIAQAVELFPCDLIFVHRDAENAAIEHRLKEVSDSVRASRIHAVSIAVVPVRMQEAWLLIDESALRRAAGNPNGNERLTLPSIGQVERLPDPKSLLHQLLRQASGLRGRGLRRFNRTRHGRRVADYIDDFQPLFRLAAFRRLAAEVERVATERGWRHSA